MLTLNGNYPHILLEQRFKIFDSGRMASNDLNAFISKDTRDLIAGHEERERPIFRNPLRQLTLGMGI
jgi:hypothetical protein